MCSNEEDDGDDDVARQQLDSLRPGTLSELLPPSTLSRCILKGGLTESIVYSVDPSTFQPCAWDSGPWS